MSVMWSSTDPHLAAHTVPVLFLHLPVDHRSHTKVCTATTWSEQLKWTYHISLLGFLIPHDASV